MITEEALSIVALGLKIPVKWLRDLITFESKWNPKAKNPKSSASGLLQFTDTTARALGYTSARDLVAKYPGATDQLLGPVRAYFKLPGNQGPYPTPQSLYMTVFYPEARGWSPEKRFPAWVTKSNPGIVTVKDYINRVEGNLAKKGISAVIVAGILFIIYTLTKGDRK